MGFLIEEHEGGRCPDFLLSGLSFHFVKNDGLLRRAGQLARQRQHCQYPNAQCVKKYPALPHAAQCRAAQ